MCYRSEFGHSTSNHMGVREGFQRFGDTAAPPLWIQAWLNPRKTPLPHMCYRANFGRSRQNGMSVRTIPGKNGPLTFYLEGHSKSLEPTWIDDYL